MPFPLQFSDMDSEPDELPDDVVEQTADGWTMTVRAQVIYQNAEGEFVSREDYVQNREGYGGEGYGPEHGDISDSDTK